ncbi:MAG: hypothetical protein ABIR94_22615 [Rubrivivax sp.]
MSFYTGFFDEAIWHSSREADSNVRGRPHCPALSLILTGRSRRFGGVRQSAAVCQVGIAQKGARRIDPVACQEDDRHTAPLVVAAHPLSQIKAIDRGHLHVYERQRHFMLSQEIDSSRSGACYQQGEARPDYPWSRRKGL